MRCRPRRRRHLARRRAAAAWRGTANPIWATVATKPATAVTARIGTTTCADVAAACPCSTSPSGAGVRSTLGDREQAPAHRLAQAADGLPSPLRQVASNAASSTVAAVISDRLRNAPVGARLLAAFGCWFFGTVGGRLRPCATPAPARRRASESPTSAKLVIEETHRERLRRGEHEEPGRDVQREADDEDVELRDQLARARPCAAFTSSSSTSTGAAILSATTKSPPARSSTMPKPGGRRQAAAERQHAEAVGDARGSARGGRRPTRKTSSASRFCHCASDVMCSWRLRVDQVREPDAHLDAGELRRPSAPRRRSSCATRPIVNPIMVSNAEHRRAAPSARPSRGDRRRLGPSSGSIASVEEEHQRRPHPHRRRPRARRSAP